MRCHAACGPNQEDAREGGPQARPQVAAPDRPTQPWPRRSTGRRAARGPAGGRVGLALPAMAAPLGRPLRHKGDPSRRAAPLRRGPAARGLGQPPCRAAARGPPADAPPRGGPAKEPWEGGTEAGQPVALLPLDPRAPAKG